MNRLGSTTAAGYGHTHQQARRAALTRHHPEDPCPRCGQPLGPTHGWRHVKTRGTVEYGSLLDYDHTGDRTGYLGLAHSRCNRTAGARLGGQTIAARRRGHTTRTSRSW